MRWVEAEGGSPDAFVTETGCTVRVVQHWHVEHGLTGNTLLILRMDQPDDGREAEVLLTPAERIALRLLLEKEPT